VDGRRGTVRCTRGTARGTQVTAYVRGGSDGLSVSSACTNIFNGPALSVSSSICIWAHARNTSFPLHLAWARGSLSCFESHQRTTKTGTSALAVTAAAAGGAVRGGAVRCRTATCTPRTRRDRRANGRGDSLDFSPRTFRERAVNRLNLNHRSAKTAGRSGCRGRQTLDLKRERHYPLNLAENREIVRFLGQGCLQLHSA
jgi:hypothetical protein